MKKSLILAVAAIATVLVALPSSASAQVAFGGTFRGPHGSFSIGVGGFEPIAGAYVPSPYVDQIYYVPDYGYGFYYDDQWVPCQQYGSQWVIASAPFFIQRPYVHNYGYYSRPYYSRPYSRPYYSRPYYSRPYYSRPFYGNRSFGHGWDGRSFRRDDGRSFRRDDGRSFQRNDGRSFQHNDGRRDGGNRRW